MYSFLRNLTAKLDWLKGSHYQTFVHFDPARREAGLQRRELSCFFYLCFLFCLSFYLCFCFSNFSTTQRAILLLSSTPPLVSCFCSLFSLYLLWPFFLCLCEPCTSLGSKNVHIIYVGVRVQMPACTKLFLLCVSCTYFETLVISQVKIFSEDSPRKAERCE